MTPRTNAFHPLTLSAHHDDICTWQLDAQVAREAAREAAGTRAAAGRTAQRPAPRRRVRWTDVFSVLLVVGAASAPLFLIPALHGDDRAADAGPTLAVVNPPAR